MALCTITNESLQANLKAIQPVDTAWATQAQNWLDGLTKPVGSLGRLEELACQLAAMQRRCPPSVHHKWIITMAGDHGVVAEGVSLFPQDVTRKMLPNFLEGRAGVNILARQVGAQVLVVDMGVVGPVTDDSALVRRSLGAGTRNLAREAAMSHDQAIAALSTGMDVLEQVMSQHSLDVVGLGDMGIANTTPSSAIMAAVLGLGARQATGRGTGLGDEQYQHKVDVVRRALDRAQLTPDDPVRVLAEVGGFEIGGLAGVTLAAAKHHIPVVVDGHIATAAALLAYQLCPAVSGYCVASHRSTEPAQIRALEFMGLTPLLDLGMRLGEGTGAAVAMHLLEASCRIASELPPFQDIGVTIS